MTRKKTARKKSRKTSPAKPSVRKTVSGGRRRKRKTVRTGKPSGVRNFFIRLAGDSGAFCIMAMAGLALVFAFFTRGLPDTSKLWKNTTRPETTILAADGSPLSVRGTTTGAPVRLVDLPRHVPAAILAVEDRNFYHHAGINPVSLVRALTVNIRHGQVRQGGSTITQQLAKNVFLSPDRTLKRKIREVFLALWLEMKFSKDEILTLYMNRVYFGAGAYGIDAASHRYFGKPASEISVPEAAMLAGLLKAPSRYAPTVNPETAIQRGNMVIGQMRKAGFLTHDEAVSAISAPPRPVQERYPAAPFFIDYILARARRLSGNPDADLVIRTTLDPSAQEAVRLGMIAGFAQGRPAPHDVEAAVVVMDGATGAVRAMAGGRNYAGSQFNRAVHARRQPGSAFKPVVYLAALEAGTGAGTVIHDGPLTIEGWSPDNYNSAYYGPVSMHEALARSLNSATLRLQEHTGRNRVRTMARKLGWSGTLTGGPSLGLGVDGVSPLELAGIFAPFSNGGYRVDPYVISRIETADGQTVYRHPGTQPAEPVARARSIAALDSMLRGVVSEGSGRAARIPGYDIAGKTGTTQDGRDTWFAGYAGGIVTVVWTGRDDYTPVRGASGGQLPARIWKQIMSRALATPCLPSPGSSGQQDPCPARPETGRQRRAP